MLDSSSQVLLRYLKKLLRSWLGAEKPNKAAIRKLKALITELEK